MATTVTLHPNGTIANSGFTVVGDATAHGALADPSGSDYVQGEDAVADSLELNWETYVLAANERCKRIRGLLNIARYPGNTKMSIDYGPGSFRTIDSNTVGVVLLTGSWQTPTGLSSPSTGVSQAEIDGITADIDSTYVGDSFIQIYEARIQLEIILRPEVSLTPSAYVYDRDISTYLPWTYTGNGETQKKYHLKVFTQAQVIGGGFDPDVTVPIYDSGIVTSSSAGALASGLSYATEYVAFVKVAKDFTMPGSLVTDWWSDWEQSTPWFTLELPVATSITPSTAALTNNKPLIDWTFTPTAALTPGGTDPIPAQYQVKVFKAPGGGWGGFDPDTNTADLIQDSGIVVSSTDSSFQMTIALANNTEHRAYVKLWRTSGSFSPHVPGAWAYSTFTTDFIAPATPVLSTVIAPNAVDVLVTVTPGLKNLLNANQSSVESNIFGYIFAVTSGAGGAVGAHEGTIAAHGVKSLRAEGNGAAGARTIDIEASAEVPATAGLPYTAQCEVRKVVGQPARNVRVGLRWFSAGDVLISTSWGTASAATDAFAIRSVTATAPVGTVEVTIVMEIANVDLPPEYHYFDKMMIQQTNVVNPWFSGGTPDEQFYTIQRRIDGGEWRYFRVAGDEDTFEYLHPTEPFTVTDREGRHGALHEYRASATGTALGIQTQSAWTAIESETLGYPRLLWIKDLYDPSLNAHVYVQDQWLQRVSGKSRATHRALGRSKPIVTRGQYRADSFSMTFTVLGDTMKDALDALIDSDRTLFLQTPKGNWYVEVAGDVNVQDHLWDHQEGPEEPAWLYTVPFQEVDAV